MRVYTLLLITLFALLAVQVAWAIDDEEPPLSQEELVKSGRIDRALSELNAEETTKMGTQLNKDLKALNTQLSASITGLHELKTLDKVMDYANYVQTFFAALGKHTAGTSLVTQYQSATSLFGIDAAVKISISLLINSWMTDVANAHRIMDITSVIKDLAGRNSENTMYHSKLLGTVHFSIPFYGAGNTETCFQDAKLKPLRERLNKLADVSALWYNHITEEDAGKCFIQVAPVLLAWARQVNSFMDMANKCKSKEHMKKFHTNPKKCALCSEEKLRDALPEVMTFTFEGFEGAFWHALRVPPPLHEKSFKSGPLDWIKRKWQKHVHNGSKCKKYRAMFDSLIDRPLFGIPWDAHVARGVKKTTDHLANNKK